MAKKIIALLLILALTFTSLSSCSSRKDDKVQKKTSTEDKNTPEETNTKSTEVKGQTKKTDKTMGRYIEKKVDFPKLKDKEKILKILQGADNQIELYTKTGAEYMCYRLNADMSWDSSKPGWLNDGKLNNDNFVINSLCYGEDGCYYLSYIENNEKGKSHVIKADSKGETAQEMELSYLNEMQSMAEYYYYPLINKIDVLKNGNLVLFDMNPLNPGNTLDIVSPQGEKIDAVAIAPVPYSPSFITSDNDIITASVERKSIIFYDTIKKLIRRTTEYVMKRYCFAVAEQEDGTIYMCNSQGIHRLSEMGTLWETIVDGSLCSMSMTSLGVDEFFIKKAEEEEYFVSFMNSDGGFQLMHYIFDKSVPSIPTNELTVYSLWENSNIRQAAAMLQARNTDVKVNYVVAMGEEGGTTADYIRALNTVLMAGSGPDVLVLDGLPIASYIEKGVLADISDTIKPLEEEDVLQSNITDCYKDDGKVYQIPIRYAMPFIVGKQEAINSMHSLEGIAGYIAKIKEPFMFSPSYRYLLKTYLDLYIGDLYEDGNLPKERLTSFLKNLKILADNIHASEFSNKDPEYEEENSNADRILCKFTFGYRDDTAIKGKSAYNFNSLRDSFAYMRRDSLSCSSINQMFVPSGLVGVNSASKITDIAKQFINLLLSEEVQSTDMYDGFPVNKTAIKKWLEKEDDSIYTLGDSEGNKISLPYPTKEEREKILNLLQELHTPVNVDQVVDDIIIGETLSYFKGESDADQAASAAYSKLRTYMEE